MGPEEAFVRAFVARNRRQKWLEAVRDPAERGYALGRLDHINDFVDAYCEDYRPTGQGYEMVENIAEMLRKRGAGRTCHVLSPMEEVDGQALPLTSALAAVLGWDSAVLICVPDQLALYLPEPPARPIVLLRPKHG
jgi:hypothetical protein